MRPEKKARPYSTAVTWAKTPIAVRRELSRQQESDYSRIAALPAAWGNALDGLGAPYRVIRWVAGPAKRAEMIHVTEARYRAVVAIFREHATPAARHAALEELTQTADRVLPGKGRTEKRHTVTPVVTDGVTNSVTLP